MAKVLGIGGFFFHCKDIEATREWYARVLGLNIDEMGGTMFSHGEAAEAFGKGAITLLSSAWTSEMTRFTLRRPHR